MADVLIVCVREDEPQAKALADMFEAAGFSIGGAPSSDSALRSSGAGVVVWSQASIRSRPFLDAAQRVINADKAIVASLIDPPPPSSIGSSLAFDLSDWDGDPNDPALDPLFFAVDRMVNTARAGVGAAQRETPAYDPPPQRSAPARPEPPPRRPESDYRVRAPEPAPSYRVPPSSDPLGSEAEHWRAIRDSRNPSDFMDYLARYGPEGAFSEVAELRLKQLTGPGEARMPAAPSRPTVRPPPPAPRAEAPRRAEPPPRRADALPPTQRRLEPAPPNRRPPIERDYTRDLRDPPKGEGGPLRAFVLIALLGGAALAAGLYFSGGMSNSAPAAPAAVESTPASTSETANDLAGLEEAPSVPLSEAAGAAQPTDTAREERERQRRERERERQREAQRAAELAAQRDAAATRIANNAASGGPVPLSPNANQTPVVPIPAPPPVQTANVEPNIVGPSTQARPPGSVVWAQRPSSRRIEELYPPRALRGGVGGRVVLDCRVQSSLAVNCSVASETPAGEGFGRAALGVANAYRARATLSDGTSSIGASTRIAVNFQAPQ
jgi:protein TonB